jgi:hypothetical protein
MRVHLPEAVAGEQADLQRVAFKQSFTADFQGVILTS